MRQSRINCQQEKKKASKYFFEHIYCGCYILFKCFLSVFIVFKAVFVFCKNLVSNFFIFFFLVARLSYDFNVVLSSISLGFLKFFRKFGAFLWMLALYPHILSPVHAPDNFQKNVFIFLNIYI